MKRQTEMLIKRHLFSHEPSTTMKESNGETKKKNDLFSFRTIPTKLSIKTVSERTMIDRFDYTIRLTKRRITLTETFGQRISVITLTVFDTAKKRKWSGGSVHFDLSPIFYLLKTTKSSSPNDRLREDVNPSGTD